MEETTYGITVQSLHGRQFQTWVTTTKDGEQLIAAIEAQFDEH